MIEESILKHAIKEYPKESCGVIIIFKGREKYVACDNISLEPNKSFQINPLDYARAEEMGEVIKIVHSHPNINPRPSQADLVGIEETNLPWIIVNPNTKKYTETKPTGYKAPLVGREFSANVLDCYSIVKDYYSWELNFDIPNFNREDLWWNRGSNLYLDHYKEAGFTKVNDLKKHDVLFITFSSPVPNHAAIYLGDGKILHHVQGRLSSIDVYGGFWLKNTWGQVRYKELL